MARLRRKGIEMSADNWGRCPRCEEEDGEIGNLREDYDIGIYDGKFEVIYSGECAECDFRKKYNYEERVG